VFEHRVLRRIFGAKREEEIIKSWRNWVMRSFMFAYFTKCN
jgi:hypothetical protein